MEGRTFLRNAVPGGQTLVGILTLAASLLFAQNHDRLETRSNVSSDAITAGTLFSDDFNAGILDLNKWRRGANPGNQSAVVNNVLELRSQDYESGWVVTRNAYFARNTTITVKVEQPNNDGDLGMSPTYNLSSIYGLYNEANFYRFYTYRNTSSGAYLLYVEWKKNGVLIGFDVTGNLVINGAVYLRLRCDDTKIHFEASLDGVTWTDTYNETFDLPGYTLDTPFYYELAGYKTWSLGTFIVDDFSITSQSPGKQIAVLQDALNSNTLGSRTGGQFVSGGGWQATGVNDMIVYDLGRYVESGACEMQVRNFSPGTQNTYDRHHFLSMFRNPWGNHHPVENQETVWDLHAGFNYDPGVKMLSWTYIANEIETRVPDSWNLAQTYLIKVTWDGNHMQYFRDGILYATHAHTAEMQLRYLYIGRDLTVSADLVTNFQNNQYPAITGPIYSNIVVTETVSAADQSPPLVGNIAVNAIYANGARLAWTADEPAVCYLEYGLTNAYGQKTTVLGPPAQAFATTLASLAANQVYHYRIVALDNDGNVTTTGDQVFTTLQNGAYVFKPAADTYVEQAGLYGTTRDYGNYGWMNLLGGAGRESYLRFNIAGVDGNVTQSVLRLHGRQSGNSGGTLHVLNASWNENTVTWRTKPNVTGQQLGAVNSVQAGQWHEIDIGAAVSGNGAYEFALVGTGENVVSFDSRESTNSQPELLVTANSGGLPTLTLVFPNGGEWWFVGDTKQIQWNSSGALANVKLEFSYDAGVSWSTIVASMPNTGAYSWLVPNAVSNSGLIRVTDAANTEVADVSDGQFFVTRGALVNFTASPGNPVLSPGASGSWDENIRERGWFMYENGMYHVWYGGWQGPYNLSTSRLVKLGYAYSSDGVNWTKYSGNPIYAQDWIEDVAVVKDGNTYYMYAEDEYTGDGDGAFINLYTSTDKINWAKQGTVIYPNGAGWEAHDVGTPTVWKEGNTWYMLYEGLGNGIAGQVGLATSNDGRNWTRHTNNPVLSNPLGANLDIAIDSIIKINDVYYAYGHYDIGGHNWVTGMFTSTNLTAWTAYPGNPLPYNSPVLVDNGTNYFMYSLIPGTNGLAPYNLATSTHSTTPPLDTTPPAISAVAANNVAGTAATISWQTDEAADSQVEYGLTTSYGSSSPLNTALVTSHTVTLSSLQANTTYHYRVKSKDAAGNLAMSGDFTFTTLLPALPVISSFSPTSGPVGTQVTITGNNFTGATSVAFNGTAAASFTISSDLQMNAVVPAGATTGKISIINAAGTVTSADNFTVIVTLTFGATNDAYVQSSTPAKNYGRASDLRVRKSSPTQNTYLKFNVAGLSGSVQSARLRLYVADASSDGGAVYKVSNNYSGTSTPWLETGLKWNNAPTISGSPLASAGAVSVGQTVELDVTAAISGNGIYSFALKSNSTNAVYYHSRQGANVPVLVIQSAAGAAGAAETADGAIEPSPGLRGAETTEYFTLYPNYPNPLRLSAPQAETRLVYHLPERVHVKLALYDLLGREIMVLVNEEREAGTYEARWNGRDAVGHLLPSGTYIYSLQARGLRSSKRLLLVK